ncbi:beta-xylosidase [Asticcacaulis biprosthecium C19]|uniref:Beta-xylosidase n=1 Tax=Asticcacaulis biprosthecium C19 TaxID=715226 RepID=F4QI25_9CAUL|nr:beta-xylosidase [Asticcacaulis biprosthecium]EGF92892.1 beta-xylosidase [Asticcacaulis biprosthecium C19]
MHRLLCLTAALTALAFPAMAQDRTDDAAPPVPVTMTVDAGRTVAPLPPIWRFFGADEPNYATMKDGRKLMSHLGELRPGQVYFRAHNLLSTGDGTPAFKWGSTNAYTEDAQGNPVYNWTVVDHIIDTYLARGVKPYLQIGFTPQAMSSAPEGTPYQHTWRPGFAYDLIATGWVWPPKDYEKWEELVYQWTKHNVERYGRDEVATWYFQVWNEPNLKFYWAGTPEEFYRLHDHAIAGVRRALPEARVGGPDVAGSGGAFMDGFLKHVVTGTNYATGETGTPTDFLSFHAKGAPKFTDGHVRMSMIEQLKAIDTGFGKVAAVPELKTRPIVIGENDPEGCAACPGPQNAYRNGTLYASYTAASYARIWELAGRHKVNLDGALTWAFTFEDQPWFAGYRQLATNGIDLPVINTFRLFSQLGPDQVAATSNAQVPLNDVMASGIRGPADVGVLATRTKDNRLAILVWHYHDDDIAGPVAAVALSVSGLKGKSVKVTQWRVDGDHGNAFTAWQKMGSPQSPDQNQYAELETASKMTPQIWPEAARVTNGTAELNFTVPRQGVSLLILE